jgi:hypothetical protein
MTGRTFPTMDPFRGTPTAGYETTYGPGLLDGYSSPNLYTSSRPDSTVSSGQIAKVAAKFSTLGGDTYVVLQLPVPGDKTITIRAETCVIKIADLELAKKIYSELSASSAKAVEKSRSVGAAKVARRVFAKANQKTRQAIAKRYRLDARTLDLIELAGSANKW